MTITSTDRTQCGLMNSNIHHFQTNVQNIPFCRNVALRQYIIFCWHFLTTELSGTLGTDCRVTWRDTIQERRLHTHRCENLKFFIIHATSKRVTAHSGSYCNEPHLHYTGWWSDVTEEGPLKVFQFFLENITTCLQIGHGSHYSFSHIQFATRLPTMPH